MRYSLSNLDSCAGKPVKQYYFNFRKGDRVARDRIGMHLPDLDTAREEALYMREDLVAIATATHEGVADAEIQITDTSGETVLSISLGEQTCFIPEGGLRGTHRYH